MSNAAAESPIDDDAARRLDAQAVARTLAGDVSAFDELIERYQRRAVGVSYRLLGNTEDAMDVSQDAFLKAYRSLSTLQAPERFGAWLMRIVTNLSLNFRRGRRPSLSLSAGDDDGAADGLLADRGRQVEDSAEDKARGVETERAVSAAMEALPEQQRLALVLFAIERIPQKEVAEILECSVEMVKWNVFQARKRLKEELSEYLQE
jgi:RNA polymerase sigma-70 factor (ECF subfamily)